jgi:hypothetical protein
MSMIANAFECRFHSFLVPASATSGRGAVEVEGQTHLPHVCDGIDLRLARSVGAYPRPDAARAMPPVWDPRPWGERHSRLSVLVVVIGLIVLTAGLLAVGASRRSIRAWCPVRVGPRLLAAIPPVRLAVVAAWSA